MSVLSRTAGGALLLLLAPESGAMPLAQTQAARPAQQAGPTSPPASPAQAAPAGQDAASPAPCPAASQKPAKQKSALAQDTGGAVGGTAAQIAGAAVLGPIGAAAAAVLGAHAGKKAGGVIKTKKHADSQENPAQCAPAAQQTSAQAGQGQDSGQPDTQKFQPPSGGQ